MPLAHIKDNKMKFRNFIYNKETKESHLLGWIFLIIVTIVVAGFVYWVDKTI